MIAQLKPDSATGSVGPQGFKPRWQLAVLLQNFSRRSGQVCSTGIPLFLESFPNNKHTTRYLMTDYDHKKSREVDWVSGCCMMVPKSAFEKVGGFDEKYFLFNEDVDLCHTLKHHGYKTLYFPQAKIYHDITSSNRKVPQRIILKRHLGMSHYIDKHFIGNPILGALIHAMIAVRYCTQVVINFFK